MKGKRWLALALSLALLMGTVPQAALAQGQESAQSEAAAGDWDAPAGTITGFPQEGPILRLTVREEDRPALEELTAQMPEYLSVLVEGEEERIPVTWY